MARQYAPYLFKTISDGIAAMLVLFPFYFVTDSMPPIFSLLGLCLSIGLIFGYFLGDPTFRDKKKLVMAVTIISFGVGFLFSHPLFLTFAAVLYLLKKGFEYSEEGTKPLNGSKALWVTLLTIALFGHAQIIDYSSDLMIFVVYITFLLSFFLQMLVTGWNDSKLATRDKLPFLYLTALTVIGAMSISSFLSFLSPFIRQVMVWIILLPLWVLAWAFYPVLNWIFNLDLKMPDLPALSLGEVVLKNQDQDQVERSKIETLEVSTEFIAFLLVCLVIAVFIFIVNRGRIVQLIRSSRQEAEVTYGTLNKPSFYKKWRFRTPPNQRVRQQVWNLEKYAVKRGIERNWNETLEEWFGRSSIAKEDRTRYIETYNACRYGEKDVGEEDILWFSQHTRSIQGEIKRIAKEKKKSEKKER